MTNKVLVGILVFLMVLSSALGFYSFTLSQQIDGLSEQLVVFQDEFTTFTGESAARSDALETGISGMLVKADILEDEIGGTLARVDSLEDEVGGTLNRVGSLEDEMSGTLSRVGSLDNEIKDVASRISESWINTSSIYQRVSPATVRISNGERVVGSGFIIDADAHVVTANHVVEQLSEINIILPDGNISTATIIGISIYSDIAVLKLEEQPAVTPLTLAESATVMIGEPVVTIGSPFDLTETLTAGIVSQTNRFTEIEYDSQTRWVANLIQFDAAVNFGNSGGPLLNSKGEVIGMVIARVDPQEGDGIYYAVSSNMLKKVTTSLINQGSFDHPWIGVEIANLTPQEVQDRKLETINGVVVKTIIAGGPAEAAGLEIDDVILTIDGTTVRDIADFISYLWEYKAPEDMVSLTLIRDSTEMELSLKIGKRLL